MYLGSELILFLIREFKKEETQNVERTWSYCENRREDKRGRRKKKRKKMTPDLGTFIQIHSHKLPHTMFLALDPRYKCNQVEIWLSNLISQNSLTLVPSAISVWLALEIPVSSLHSQNLRGGELRGHVVQLLARCLNPLYTIVPSVGLASYSVDLSLIFF